MDTITNTIKHVLQAYKHASRWLVAYSGGVDSHVLLDVVVKLAQQQVVPPILIIHVNHGLQKESFAWVAHVRAVASHYHLDCSVLTIDASPPKGDSIESWAREARYQAIQNYMQVDDILLLAHHAQDQAETLLYNLMRGTGMAGLAAMPISRNLTKGTLVRPMLSIAQDNIKSYAKKHDLFCIEDPSNQDTRFARNYIRHQVLPMLEKKWPHFEKSLATCAKHAANQSTMLKMYLKPLFESLLIQDGLALDCKLLLKYDALHQAWFIRHWFQQLNLPMPSQKQMHALLHDVVLASGDCVPIAQWSKSNISVTVRRYRDALYVVKVFNHKVPELTSWCWHEALLLETGIILDAKQLFSSKQRALLGNDPLILVWQGSGKSVKKYWQTRGVPPWCRAYLPRFYQKNILLHEVNYANLYKQWHHIVEPNKDSA